VGTQRLILGDEYVNPIRGFLRSVCRAIKPPSTSVAPVPQVIRISAGVLVDPEGRVLLVRKRGTTVWMQPGGKIEPGEHPAHTLVRELSEEIGLILEATDLEYWGRFHADAANEAGHVVDAEVYFATVTTPIAVAAEIEELLWVRLDDDLEALGIPLAPLSVVHLFPLLAARTSAQAPK
jgi:8-oxo-dGTP diphosphatase